MTHCYRNGITVRSVNGLVNMATKCKPKAKKNEHFKHGYLITFVMVGLISVNTCMEIVQTP